MEAVADTRGGGKVRMRLQDPPIIFTEALVLKSGNLFQEVESLLIIQYNLDI